MSAEKGWICGEIAGELEARKNSLRNERERLMSAANRIAEIDKQLAALDVAIQENKSVLDANKDKQAAAQA